MNMVHAAGQVMFSRIHLNTGMMFKVFKTVTTQALVVNKAPALSLPTMINCYYSNVEILVDHYYSVQHWN